jgi:hypothetical protein
MRVPSSPTRSASGLAAIEFALVLPFLVLLVSFIVDVGGAFYARAQVQNAAQIGARYAQENGWNSAGIVAAVTSATDLLGIAATPAPQLVCGCPGGAAIQITPMDCTGGIPGGVYCAGVTPPEVPGRYIIVGAQYSYTAPIAFARWPSPLILSATATTRLD